MSHFLFHLSHSTPSSRTIFLIPRSLSLCACLHTAFTRSSVSSVFAAAGEEVPVVRLLAWLGHSLVRRTGLHTFLLYLSVMLLRPTSCDSLKFNKSKMPVACGPQIASVTLAAYKCGSVDFLEPRYPDQINQIICPQVEPMEGIGGAEGPVIGVAAGGLSYWTFISKVRHEKY